MALKGNGSTGWKAADFGAQADQIPGYSMFAWARNPPSTVDGIFIWGGGPFIHTGIFAVTANDGYFYDDVDNAGTDIGVSSTTTFSSTWIPILLAKKGQTGGTLYVGSMSNSYALTGSLGAQTLTDLYIGQDEGLGSVLTTTSSIAELAIWFDTLSLSEGAALMAGACPLGVCQASLACYFPLRFDLRDYGPQGLSASGVSPVFTDHPPVQRFEDVLYQDAWALFNVLYHQALGAKTPAVVAVPRTRGRPLAGVASAEVVAVSNLAAHLHPTSLAVASAEVVSAAKQYGRSPLTTTSSEAFGITFQRGRGWVIATAQGNAAAIRRLAGHALRLTQSQTATAQRGMTRMLTGAVSASATTLLRSTGIIRAVSTVNPFSSDFSMDFGAPGSPSVASVFRSPGQNLKGALQPQSTGLLKVPARLLTVAGTAIVRLMRGIPLRLNATSPEAWASPVNIRAFFRVLAAGSANTALVVRGLSATQLATTPNIAGLVRSPGKVLPIAQGYAAFTLRTIGRLISVASVGSINLVRQTRLPRGIAGGTASALLLAANHLSGVLHAVSPQVATAFSFKVFFRGLSGASSNVAAVVRNLTHNVPQALSTTQTQAAVAVRNLTRTVQQALSAAQAQVSAVTKGIGRSVAALMPSAAALRNVVGRLFGTASPETVALLTLTKHFFIAGVATVQMVTLRASFSRARGVAAGQVAKVVARHGSFLAGLSPQALAVQRGIVTGLSAVTIQVATIAAFTSKSFAVLSPATVTLIRAFARFPAVASPQIAHAVVRYGSSISGIAMGSAAGLVRLTGKLAGAIMPQASASGRIDKKIIGTTSPNVASMLRPRGFVLRAVQTQAAHVVHWFYLFVPAWAQQQTVLLPPGGGPAEPPEFGPIDPADQTTFAFDWSSRADPNDPIIMATVVSVPPGLVFAAAPVFVSGTLVEVIVAPFSPTQLPTVYRLRCTAVFASGRRSSFSIPVPVRTL